jgi:predicted SAM-dependent methyltransferase
MSRKKLIDFLNDNLKNEFVLEIGPLHKPVLKEIFIKKKYDLNKIKVLDFCDQRKLKEKYKNDKNVNIEEIGYVDYILQPDKIYNEFIDKKFNLIFSSHLIEHQPNLIRHLNDIDSILNINGYYALMIPDFRFCFDKYRPVTTILDILETFYNNIKLATAKTRLEHHLLSSDNNPQINWEEWEKNENKQEKLDFYTDKINKINCRLLGENINRELLDNFFLNPSADSFPHSLKFYPKSFCTIINILYNYNYINFTIYECFPTTKGSIEFGVILKKIR